MAKKKRIKDKLVLLFTLIAGLVFLPTTLLCIIGLMPSVAAGLVDKSREKSRLLTVGFTNLAGLFPFWCHLLEKGHTLSTALEIVTDPMNIVVIYASAMAGYALEWGVTRFSVTIATQASKSRLQEIKKIQEALVKKWGKEVVGDVPLDRDGFAITEP